MITVSSVNTKQIWVLAIICIKKKITIALLDYYYIYKIMDYYFAVNNIYSERNQYRSV